MDQIKSFFEYISSVQGDPIVLALALLIGLFGGNTRHTLVTAPLGGYVRYSFSSATGNPDAHYYLWAFVASTVLLSALVLIGRQVLSRALSLHRKGNLIR
jgi:hypothetical protein